MTKEQQAIIDLPPTARLLVTAGPGTGKTHVLIGRLSELVGAHGLSPGGEIAVLTFSRAAVREIRNRALSAAGNIRYVRAATFDSFATRLLAEFAPGENCSGDYDARIRAATELIRADEEVKERIRAFAHVFVDEVQDLVGDRAELVKAILETAAGGFTLLGDPGQGIYNFQLEGSARIEGSAALYRWLRKRFGENLEEISLTKNHRAQTKDAQIALWAGSLLNSAEPDYGAIKEKLETAVLNLPTLGQLERACSSLKMLSMRTAILCRTNGQALMISRRLYEADVPHALQRAATERVLPGWIGILFGRLEIRQVGRTAFLSRAEELIGSAFDARAAWALLQRIHGGHPQTLDVGRVAERIRSGNTPDDLLEEQRGQLVVSTIHRAKGLEFDGVILAVPDGEFGSGEPSQLAEDTRLLYVALTRPKCRLQHIELVRFKGLWENPVCDRWVRQFGWRTADFEVRGDDVHREDPAGAFLLEQRDAREIQHYLATSVRRGDPVLLTRLKTSAPGGQPRVFYQIEHASRPIGVTSEAFGAALFKGLKCHAKWIVNWPVRIENLRVEAVDTVAGSDASGKRCGLGSSGLWLRTRVSGLGALHFEKLEK